MQILDYIHAKLLFCLNTLTTMRQQCVVYTYLKVCDLCNAEYISAILAARGIKSNKTERICHRTQLNEIRQKSND